MERDFETNSSHYVTSRVALWCPICGAAAGQGCKPVKGLRFHGHNIYALGQESRQPSATEFTTEFWKSVSSNIPRRLYFN